MPIPLPPTIHTSSNKTTVLKDVLYQNKNYLPAYDWKDAATFLEDRLKKPNSPKETIQKNLTNFINDLLDQLENLGFDVSTIRDRLGEFLKKLLS